MIKIKQAVIVEGKYDKIKLSSILDTLILETNGFRIFQDPEKMQLIRKLAETHGIIILTDSDAAGFQIRSYLAQSLPPDRITHVYIPDIAGKEKRKSAPSSEGKLGVEGVPAPLLIQALERAGVLHSNAEIRTQAVTKAVLYEDGFIGKQNSAEKRRLLLRELKLPARLSANSLIQVLNSMFSFEEYQAACQKIHQIHV